MWFPENKQTKQIHKIPNQNKLSTKQKRTNKINPNKAKKPPNPHPQNKTIPPKHVKENQIPGEKNNQKLPQTKPKQHPQKALKTKPKQKNPQTKQAHTHTQK